MKSTGMVKRVLCLALVLMLASMSLMTAFASSKKSYYVSVSRLYVRSGPSSSYSTVKTLKKGTVVTRYSSKNNWYYVKYSGGSGWVYKGYLSSVKSSSGSTTTSKGYKTTTAVRVRASATTNSGIVGKLSKGKSVTVKKQKGSWAYVTYSGGSGWVSTKYLKRG